MGAIEGTLEHLCGTLANMFTEAAKLDLPNSYHDVGSNLLNHSSLEQNATDHVVIWNKELQHLLAWLGWPIWQRCEPECSPNVG